MARFLEVSLDGLIYIILAILLGPAILLAFVGFMLRKNNKKTAKIFFILAVVYAIVSLGICGSMMLS
ncbi:hypothetical protein [Tamlana flava]|uniref:hypothetical protein n=1 Tax=Tamlana flava TaxID=3158572 RepID=UPI00351B047B